MLTYVDYNKTSCCSKKGIIYTCSYPVKPSAKLYILFLFIMALYDNLIIMLNITLSLFSVVPEKQHLADELQSDIDIPEEL